mmetsp:Transcript_51558/g.134187  ORF Transcript_51558/g.134187 Transcript_51558/m.134187 type:complete len:260 (+) Transcript_51558:247-1026(+)
MILCAQAVRIFLPRIGLVALRGLGPRLHGAAPVQDVAYALRARFHGASQGVRVPRLVEMLVVVHEDDIEGGLVVRHARLRHLRELGGPVALAEPVQVHHHNARVEGGEGVCLVEVLGTRPPRELLLHNRAPLDRARRNSMRHLHLVELGHVFAHDGVHVEPQHPGQVAEHLCQVEAREDRGLAKLVLVTPAARGALGAGAHDRGVPRQRRHHVQGRHGDLGERSHVALEAREHLAGLRDVVRRDDHVDVAPLALKVPGD